VKYACVLLLSILSIGTFSCTEQQASISDKQALKDIIIKQNEAFRARDFQGEADTWAHEPDITRILYQGLVITSWDSIGDWYQRAFEQADGPSENPLPEYSNHQFVIRENSAWVGYEQVADVVIGGESYAERNWEVRGFQKIEGSWKMVFQFTGAPRVTSDNEVIAALRYKGYELRYRGQEEKGLELLQLLEKWYPESSRIQADIGYLHLATGDTTSAVPHFEKAVELNSGYENAALKLDEIRG
jgi:tetratricopeptide (TPR) repeat protein